MNSRQPQQPPTPTIVANSAGLMAQKVSRENAPNRRGLANNVVHIGGTRSAMKYMRKLHQSSNEGDRYVVKNQRKSSATDTTDSGWRFSKMLHYHEASEHLNKPVKNHMKAYKTLYY